MQNVIDRQPQNPNQYTLSRSDGSSETVILTRDDNPVVGKEGTNLNRALFNDLQDFVDSLTVFNADGSIVEEYATCDVKTIFNTDGSIDEVRMDKLGNVIDTKRTLFNSDGSIGGVML